MISSKTSFIALIGNPVGHSLSPIMLNAALDYLGLDLIYIAIPCITLHGASPAITKNKN